MSDPETKPGTAFAAEHRQGGTFLLGGGLAVELERDAPAPKPSPVVVKTFPPSKKREG